MPENGTGNFSRRVVRISRNERKEIPKRSTGKRTVSFQDSHDLVEVVDSFGMRLGFTIMRDDENIRQHFLRTFGQIVIPEFVQRNARRIFIIRTSQRLDVVIAFLQVEEIPAFFSAPTSFFADEKSYGVQVLDTVLMFFERTVAVR